jgi:hypothetical protein
MTATHTPGPWRYFVEDDEGPAKLPGTFTVDDAGLDWIAQGIEYEANARLIAAAPDLLAALKALDDLRRPTVQGSLGMVLMAIPTTHPLWDDARAAIAKATGE